MKDDRVYEVRLTATESTQIEQAQTMFMSSVFDQSKKSGLVGHGLEITLLNEIRVIE